jgi:NADPH:quinone reductase-like Zn-dependent oxidoreductase
MHAASLNRGELIVGHAVKTGGPAKAAGGEGAGEVAKLGAGVTGFKIGDRVMGRCSGAFAEHSLIDAREALAMPKNLSWEEAACIPLVFMVVHDMLIAQGKLKAGEWLLVTGISSGVGVAALQTAKALGAKVIGTSGSQEKLDKLKAMGLDVGIRTRAGDFADAVKSEIDLETLHTKRLTLFGVSNRLRTPEQRAVTVRAFAADVLPLIAAGKIKPLIDRVFPFAELPAAKAYMESNAHLGKIAVRID